VRHQRTGKKLGRDSAHRKALYSNLTGSLIEHGRIKTTEAKAKAVKPIAEPALAHGMENFPIEELELGVRSYNCLKRVGIETIGDLVVKTENELAAIPNFGKKSVEEVKETLAAHGLTLRGDESGNGGL